MAIDVVQWLPKNELTVTRIVADVQPIPDVPPWAAFKIEGFVHLLAGCPGIDTADNHIDGVVIIRSVVFAIFREEDFF